MTLHIHSKVGHEYDFKVTKSKKTGARYFKLYRANNEFWSLHCRGELICTAIEDHSTPRLIQGKDEDIWSITILCQAIRYYHNTYRPVKWMDDFTISQKRKEGKL